MSRIFLLLAVAGLVLSACDTEDYNIDVHKRGTYLNGQETEAILITPFTITKFRVEEVNGKIIKKDFFWVKRVYEKDGVIYDEYDDSVENIIFDFNKRTVKIPPDETIYEKKSVHNIIDYSFIPQDRRIL